MKKRILLIALAILSIGILVTVSGRAQEDSPEEPQAQPQEQPPASTTVGRLSVVQGQVSTMHGDGTGWSTATVNTPVVLGDKLSTADRSRAEVQLDANNILRMDQHTEAQVADLQATKINIQLASGLVDYSALPERKRTLKWTRPTWAFTPWRLGSTGFK